MKTLGTILITFVANAAALYVASWWIRGFEVHLHELAYAAAAFSAIFLVLNPYLVQNVHKTLQGGIGVIVAAIGLYAVAWYFDDVVLGGYQAWALTAVVVWVISTLLSLMLEKLLN